MNRVIQSCATGDLNFTSTQQHTSSRQQLHIQDEAEAMSSFRIDDDLGVNPDLNPFSSNLHGLEASSTRIAGVLEEYLDYKRQHNDKLLDVVNQIDQQAEGCNKKEEYCIGSMAAAMGNIWLMIWNDDQAAAGGGNSDPFLTEDDFY
ncbi:hypothetical protein ACJX0J_037493 [Zea mays]